MRVNQEFACDIIQIPIDGTHRRLESTHVLLTRVSSLRS